MEAFLEFSHKCLTFLEEFATVHAVIGNEACDLDSTVAALVHAYYLNKVKKQPDTVYIPVLNIPRKEFNLKTASTYWLDRCKIAVDQLTFRDEINLESLYASGTMKMTLVDHNVVVDRDKELVSAVVDIIDHHHNERPENDSCSVVIEMVGSCCTLVAENLLNDKNFQLDKQTALLLYGTIVLDTVCLSEEAGRKTEKDEKVIEQLEKYLVDVDPDLDRAKVFDDIQSAKFDVSGLSNQELLRKDLKIAVSKKMNVAVSSITMNMEDILQKENLLSDMSTFCDYNQSAVLVLMSLSHDIPTVPKREILVYSGNSDFLKGVVDALLEAKSPVSLDLSPLPCSIDNCIVFTQSNIKASRKIVLPIIKNFLALENENNSASETIEGNVGGDGDNKEVAIDNSLLDFNTESAKIKLSVENDEIFGDISTDSMSSIAVLENQTLMENNDFDPFASLQRDSTELGTSTAVENLYPFEGSLGEKSTMIEKLNPFGSDLDGLDPFASTTGTSVHVQEGATINPLDDDNDPFGLGITSSLQQEGVKIENQGLDILTATDLKSSDETVPELKSENQEFSVKDFVQSDLTQSEVESVSNAANLTDEITNENQKDVMEDFDPFSTDDLDNNERMEEQETVASKLLDVDISSPQSCSYPSTPPSSFVDSSMANYAKETVLPSFNTSEMVRRIHRKKQTMAVNYDDSDKKVELEIERSCEEDMENSRPYTPRNSFHEEMADNLVSPQDHLPSFHSSEMVQKIENKRKEAYGSFETVKQYPFTPQNSLVEGHFDEYAKQQLPVWNGRDAGDLVHMVHEKKRSMEDLLHLDHVENDDQSINLSSDNITENDNDSGFVVVEDTESDFEPKHINSQCKNDDGVKDSTGEDIIANNRAEEDNADDGIDIQEVAYMVTHSIIEKALESYPVHLEFNKKDSLSSYSSDNTSKGTSEKSLNDSNDLQNSRQQGFLVPTHCVGSAEIPVETDYLSTVDPLHGQMDIVHSPKKSFATDAVKDVAESTSFEKLRAESTNLEDTNEDDSETVVAAMQNEKQNLANNEMDPSINNGIEKQEQISLDTVNLPNAIANETSDENLPGSNKTEAVSSDRVEMDITVDTETVSEKIVMKNDKITLQDATIDESVDSNIKEDYEQSFIDVSTQNVDSTGKKNYIRGTMSDSAEELTLQDSSSTQKSEDESEKKEDIDISIEVVEAMESVKLSAELSDISVYTENSATVAQNVDHRSTDMVASENASNNEEKLQIQVGNENISEKPFQSSSNTKEIDGVVQGTELKEDTTIQHEKIQNGQLGEREEAEGQEDVLQSKIRGESFTSEDIYLDDITRELSDDENDHTSAVRPHTLDPSGGAVPKRKIKPNLEMFNDEDEQSFTSKDISENELLAMVDNMKTPDDLETPDINISLMSEIDISGTPTKPAVEPIPEYTAEEERENERHWRSVEISGKKYKVDMKVIEPYKKVLSHGGYYEGCNAIIVFAACYLPDRSRKDYQYVMENLFLYVVSTLELLVAEDYLIIYLHGATPKKQMPGLAWLKKYYQTLDRRLRKNLKKLYLVHPTVWLKTVMFLARPFISSKFARKVSYVSTIANLASLVNLEYVFIPEPVKNLDSAISSKHAKQ